MVLSSFSICGVGPEDTCASPSDRGVWTRRGPKTHFIIPEFSVQATFFPTFRCGAASPGVRYSEPLGCSPRQDPRGSEYLTPGLDTVLDTVPDCSPSAGWLSSNRDAP